MEVNQFRNFDRLDVARRLLFDSGGRIEFATVTAVILAVRNYVGTRVERRVLHFQLRGLVRGGDFVVASGRLRQEGQPVVRVGDATHRREITVLDAFRKLIPLHGLHLRRLSVRRFCGVFARPGAAHGCFEGLVATHFLGRTVLTRHRLVFMVTVCHLFLH